MENQTSISEKKVLLIGIIALLVHFLVITPIKTLWERYDFFPKEQVTSSKGYDSHADNMGWRPDNLSISNDLPWTESSSDYENMGEDGLHIEEFLENNSSQEVPWSDIKARQQGIEIHPVGENDTAP